MAREKFIALFPWMVKDLGLKGSELIAYALIYGVEQNCGRYYGSAEYLATVWLGLTPKQGYRVLNTLINKGLLKKWNENGRVHYSAIVPEADDSVAKTGNSGAKMRPDNIDYNINNIDNIDNIYKQNGSSKIEPSNCRGTSENLCLFEDSKFAKFEDFAPCFKEPEFAQVDLYYYWQVIMDWSRSKANKKRDWIATARNWMRSEAAAGKLKRVQQQAGVALSPDAVHYLEMAGGLFDE